MWVNGKGMGMRKRKCGQKIAVVLATVLLLLQTAITAYGSPGPEAMPVMGEAVGMVPGTETAVDVGQMPPGDHGTTLSPVITVGDDERLTEEAGPAAAEQAAAEQAAAEQAAAEQAAAEQGQQNSGRRNRQPRLPASQAAVILIRINRWWH